MKEWFKELPARIKESFSWLSVQIMAVWGVVWVVYSALPSDTVKELNNTILAVWIIKLTVPQWMGLGQTVMTYIGRLKKTPDKQ